MDDNGTRIFNRRVPSEPFAGHLKPVQAEKDSRQPYLSLIYPPDKQASYPVTREKQTIGRGKNVAVTVNESQASREHCRFWLEGGKVMIEDLQSTNGTLIDNRFIEKSVLRRRSRLVIGDHIFKLDYRDRANTSKPSPSRSTARRTLLDQAQNLYDRCQSMDRELSVLLLDLDNFQQINHEHGYKTGDRIIKQADQILAESCHTDDLLGRYGGTQFMMLLADRTEPETREFCTGLLSQIEGYRFADGAAVTLSIGASHDRGDALPGLRESIARADVELNRAKRNGRNCVCCDWESD